MRGRVGGPGAERYACIEVGSSSVKFTCFEVFAYPDGTYDTAVVASGTEKSALVDGLAKMGRFDGEELDRVARAVQAYRDKLEQEHGVPADRIVVVGSGGLLGPIRDRDLEAGAKEKLMRAAEQALAAAVRKATGSAIDVVTPEREIAYQIKGAVRKADRSDALFLDIGGGASRFGYVRPSGTVQYYTEDGVKSFLGKVKGSVGKAKAKMKGKAKPGKAAAAAWLAALAKSELRDPIRARAEADRDLVVREKLYCSGGIMWVLATTMRPRECAEPPEKVAYVTLTVKDLEDFVDRVRDDPKFLDSFQVPAGLSDEQRARVEDDIKKMRKFFTSEWLLSGAAVVEAFTKELELGKKKEIKFFRLGENAWQMGYIVDRLK